MEDHGSIGQSKPARLPVGAYLFAFVAMLAAGLLTRTEALTDWDSWDYAWMALQRQPSGLCLGRWWFIFLMRCSWLIGSLFGVSRASAFVPMQLSVAVMTAAGLVAVMHWTFRLTGDRLAAIAAGVAIGVSPSLLAYASGVMTEGPTMLLMIGAWLCWAAALRGAEKGGIAGGGGLAWLGGILFGAAVSMREPALLFGCWPIANCFVSRQRGRWGLLVLALAGTGLSLGFAVLMAWQWSGIHPAVVMQRYAAYMAKERAAYGFSGLANVVFLVLHWLTATPLGAVSLGIAIVAVLRRKLKSGRVWPAVAEPPVADPRAVRRRMWALAISTIPYLLMTWWNPDLSFNYRLLLPLAAVLAPLLGWIAAGQLRRFAELWSRWQPKHRRVVVASAVVLAGLMGFGGYKRLSYHFDSAVYQAELYDAMVQLPEAAAVYPGPGSAIGLYLYRSGAKPYWHVHANTPEAADWTPASLAAEARRVMRLGASVYVNANPKGWTRATGPNPEWKAISGFLAGGDWQDGPGPFVKLVPPGESDQPLAQPPAER